MYQSGQATGTKWFFFLAIVILAGAFALGFNIKDATWLNGQIASATAREMNVQTDIQRQQGELNLQLLQAQTNAQIEQQKQQTAYEAAKQQLDLQAASVANAQAAAFRSALYNVLNIGLAIFVIALCVALAVIGISAGFGLYKVLSAKAQSTQPSRPSIIVVRKDHRRPSVAAQEARRREREERVRQLLNNSRAIWPDDGKAEAPTPENYPWAS